MGKKTIAESVDGEAGLVALRAIGVDFAQGHWIAPPKPFLIPAVAETGALGMAPDSVPILQLNRVVPA
jgi:EAL domain-containing protein (putative c-di-GMP-specific phosphodiesterase class I)